MEGKYIYGIVKKSKIKNQKSKIEDFDGLSIVEFRNLSAVIRETEYKDYHNLPKEEVIKELISHQQAIEKIMEQFTVLPVKFGTVLKDEEEVRTVLAKGYSFLRDTLLKMEDKIELDLVCLWNEQKAAQMAYQESRKVKNCQRSLAKKGKAALEGKIALGKEVAKYLAAKREDLSSQVLRVLRKEVVESCNHALADVNMLLNQAFLVEKENEERFNHTLNSLDSKFADLVNFRLVGPLPPYSFATVVVESFDGKEVEKAKDVLELNGHLSPRKIKRAYNKLASKLHPDVGGNLMEFKLVTQSYKLLRKFAKYGLVSVYLYKWEEWGEL